MAPILASAPLTDVIFFFFDCREEENRALPGAKSSGPGPSLSAQHQPHRQKQLHYPTHGGMLCVSVMDCFRPKSHVEAITAGLWLIWLGMSFHLQMQTKVQAKPLIIPIFVFNSH